MMLSDIRSVTGKCLAAACLALSAASAHGSGSDMPRKDLALSYHARETVNFRDNDILRFRYGIEAPGFAALSRLTLFGGFRDVGLNFLARTHNISVDDPDIGAEALWLADRADGRHGIGARINHAGDHETSLEVAGVYERFDRMFDLRLVGGLQGVTDTVTGREDFGAFGVGEATWWYSENMLFRGGLQADSDGEIASIGFEVAIGSRPLSFYLDWGHALDEYRGISGYNDLSGGFRYVIGGGTLREQTRGRGFRSMFRPVEVQ